MTKFTKERLEEIAELARKAIYKPCAMHMTNLLVVCDSEVIEEMARQLLDSMEQEPLYQVRHGDKWRDLNKAQYDDNVNFGAEGLRIVYAAPPAPLVDANGWLPCPFCNSPVKWCGENSADPEDDHVCHHIQCTNPECGADFDFTNTGDDLLTDDPAVLDSMTSAELVQPLRAVCKGRFNRRAAMLQGSQPVSNRDELPKEKGASLQLRNLIRQRHAEWSDKTFGNVGPVGPLKHLSKEALEAAAEPDDLSEWADMQFLLWDAQRRAGICDGEITAAMEEKLKVNMARQWPEPKDGEPRLHIKEVGNSPVIPDSSEDTKRLNWLDAQNKRLNEYYGTSYGWKFDANFQRNAMMLNDSNYPVMTIRQAIDEAIASAPKQENI